MVNYFGILQNIFALYYFYISVSFAAELKQLNFFIHFLAIYCQEKLFNFVLLRVTTVH